MKDTRIALRSILEDKHNIFNSILFDDIVSLISKAKYSSYDEGFHDGYEQSSEENDS